MSVSLHHSGITNKTFLFSKWTLIGRKKANNDSTPANYYMWDLFAGLPTS